MKMYDGNIFIGRIYFDGIVFGITLGKMIDHFVQKIQTKF